MSFAGDLFPFRRNNRSQGLLSPQDNIYAYSRSPTLSELMSTESESSSIDHTIVITAPLVVAQPVRTRNTDQNPVNVAQPNQQRRERDESIYHGIKCWAITTFWSFATIAFFYFVTWHQMRHGSSQPH